MGTFVGHILPGVGFLLLGLWHCYNTIIAAHPWSYKPRTWYPLPVRRLRRGELIFIALGSCLSISAELFICPKAHQPWAEDWSIPPNHLNNFEHSTISLFLLIYAILAIVVENIHLPQGFLHGLAAIALSQELLLFHFHSADHMGLEGHYHWLLQLPIAVSIFCLVAEMMVQSLPMLAILRSLGILFQGTWFIQMGMVLWTPTLLPKGCAMVAANGSETVRCATEDATHYAKALANLQFSWHLAALVVATGGVMAWVERRRMTGYHHLADSRPSEKFKIADEMEAFGLERGDSPTKSSVEMHAMVDALDLER